MSKIRVFIACVLVAIALKFIIGCAAPQLFEPAPPKYKVDALYEPYLEEFVEVAKENGYDISYIYDYDIVIVSADEMLEKTQQVGRSYGKDKDYIAIFIHEGRFLKEGRGENGKKYVVFHELFHDVFNMGHVNKFGHLMQPNAVKDPSDMYLSNALWRAFKSYQND